VLAAVLSIALGAIALRAPLFDLPLEHDEGGYAYIAWRLAEGETPYLDWFDQKAPGVFLAYRLALAAPFDPAFAIRGLAALFCAGSALALFALVRALLGTATGLIAALLLVFVSADPMLQGPIANTELFMTPWIVASALLTLQLPAHARPPLARAVAIGACLAIGTAFKQVALIDAPFLLAVFALRAPSGERARAALRFAIGMAAGGIAVWGAILLWLWSRGALAPALDAILLHNLDYGAEIPIAARFAMLQHYVPTLLPSQGVAWLLALAGLVVLARRQDRFPALFLGGFAAANAIGVSSSGYYFPHYFQQVAPAVAALAAVAITGGVDRSPRWRIAGGTALALAPFAWAAIGFWQLLPAEASRRMFPDNYFETMPAIAEVIASRTAPNDRVFVFGAEPEILFQARRVSASRYIYLYPVFGAFPDVAQRQAEVIAEVEAARPAAIVWLPLQSFFGPGRSQHLTDWTRAYIDEHYRLEAYAIANAAGHSELLRVEPGGDLAPIAEQQPWGLVFVRAQ